ncbi:MAG: M48 family metalloprotease [Saccharolobus sp.]
MNLLITFALVPLIIVLEFIVLPAIILKKVIKRLYILDNYPIFVLNSNSNNAFSFTSIWGKFIVITSSLLNKEDDEHINAVIAHELGHIKLNHHIKMTIFIISIIIMLSSVLNYPLLVPLFAVFALFSQRYIQRRLELEADKFATIYVNKDLLKDIIIKYNDNKTSLLSTHPSTQVRLKNISNVK